MKLKLKAIVLLFVLTFTVSSISQPAFAQPEDTATAPVTQTDPASLPEAGVPVEKPVQAPSSPAKASSSASKSSSKPTTPKKPVIKKPTVVSSAVSSSLASTLPEPPSGTLSESSLPEIILPTVSVESGNDGQLIDSEIVPQSTDRKTNWIGIVAWVCIALGVGVVLIVVLSNFRPPNGGSGRKRYRRPNKARKHLLNDKYYRNIKY